MRIGFTGTRTETTCEQFKALCQLVQSLTGVTEWHHGACVGADSESVDVAWEFANEARRIAHPPTVTRMVSRQALDLSHEVRPSLPYLDRNRAIVKATELLIACPKEMREEQRSGTWATVRFARKHGKPIVIVYPDGTTTRENGS